jgi:hypothetical protein
MALGPAPGISCPPTGHSTVEGVRELRFGEPRGEQVVFPGLLGFGRSAERVVGVAVPGSEMGTDEFGGDPLNGLRPLDESRRMLSERSLQRRCLLKIGVARRRRPVADYLPDNSPVLLLRWGVQTGDNVEVVSHGFEKRRVDPVEVRPQPLDELDDRPRDRTDQAPAPHPGGPRVSPRPSFPPMPSPCIGSPVDDGSTRQ